jgi:hypothetical protein
MCRPRVAHNFGGSIISSSGPPHEKEGHSIFVRNQHQGVDSFLLPSEMISQLQEYYYFEAWTAEQRLVILSETKPKSLTAISYQLARTKSTVIASADAACTGKTCNGSSSGCNVKVCSTSSNNGVVLLMKNTLTLVTARPRSSLRRDISISLYRPPAGH